MGGAPRVQQRAAGGDHPHRPDQRVSPDLREGVAGGAHQGRGEDGLPVGVGGGEHDPYRGVRGPHPPAGENGVDLGQAHVGHEHVGAGGADRRRIGGVAGADDGDVRLGVEPLGDPPPDDLVGMRDEHLDHEWPSVSRGAARPGRRAGPTVARGRPRSAPRATAAWGPTDPLLPSARRGHLGAGPCVPVRTIRHAAGPPPATVADGRRGRPTPRGGSGMVHPQPSESRVGIVHRRYPRRAGLLGCRRVRDGHGILRDVFAPRGGPPAAAPGRATRDGRTITPSVTVQALC